MIEFKGPDPMSRRRPPNSPADAGPVADKPESREPQLLDRAILEVLVNQVHHLARERDVLLFRNVGKCADSPADQGK